MSIGNSYSVDIHQTLLWKVRNFPEDTYYFNPDSYLTTLMSVLLGNPGTGQFAAAQTATRINQQYMEFSDLDNILGAILSTPRLTDEIYYSSHNPFVDQLTKDQWEDVITKDASYRDRLISTASALLRGPTILGLQALSESISSSKFRVIDVWNTTAATSGTATTLAPGVVTRGLKQNETLLIPVYPADLGFSEERRDAVYTSSNQLKPAGMNITVTSGITPFTNISFTVESCSSNYFSFTRDVTGANINYPNYILDTQDTSVRSRYWVQNGVPINAPTFAHLQTQEAIIDVTGNITQATTYLYDQNNQVVSTSTTTDPIGNPGLRVTSTVYGAQ